MRGGRAGSRYVKNMTTASDSWAVQVFFDGECPLCMREIRMLRRLDRKQRIRFTDIAAADFDAHRYGTDQATLMGSIHGRVPSGEWIHGVEVFRRLYDAVGFGWIVALTRIPGVSHLLDAAYGVFARNRLRITGRCDASCALPADRTGSAA